MQDYKTLRAVGISMPELLDVDAANDRILKEYIDGDTIDRYVLRDEMRPEYAARMQTMCEKL